MKFSISSKVFASYASAVGRIVNPKSPITILTNFYMTLEGDMLTITGSDTENALTGRVRVSDAEGSGKFCIDAQRLINLLKEIPEQGMTIEVGPDMKVKIDYNIGACEFVAIPGDDFPTYEKKDSDQPVQFTCPSAIIAKGIDNTQFAASTDDYRPMMMGIYFDIHNDGITFAATDTRKLVRYRNNNCQPGVEIGCIVPSRTASIIRNVFGTDGDIRLSLTRKTATIENDDFIFNCRFLQGNFPDYNRVISDNNQLELIIDRQALLSAVRRCGLFISLDYGLEKFRISQDKVEIKSDDNSMMTTAVETLPCTFNGDTLTIGFSAPYLVAILTTLQTQEISISLSDPSRPGLFRPSENEEGTDLVMLLMPMTVGEY